MTGQDFLHQIKSFSNVSTDAALATESYRRRRDLSMFNASASLRGRISRISRLDLQRSSCGIPVTGVRKVINPRLCYPELSFIGP
jgi:hypothetical protein